MPTNTAAQQKTRPVNQANGDRMVTLAYAADFLGLTKMGVRKMINDGRLKAYRLGPRVVRLRLSEIEAALEPYGTE